jgi:DNA-3-methyladenine glycosylase II
VPASASVSANHALDHLRAADPVMGSLIDRAGPYAISYHRPVFETLVRSIVFQQLNGRAAATIYGRLNDACGRVTPESLLALRLPRLRKIGLSQQKASYVRDLARRTRDGEVNFRKLPALGDDEVIAHLTPVKGVGVWTVQMFLIFALRRPDVLPTADYGIRVAMQRAYGLEELPKPASMERIAAPWRPWRSVACWYLWRSLDNQAGI